MHALLRTSRIALLILLGALWIIPVYWVVVASVSPAVNLNSGRILPQSLTTANYSYLFDHLPVATFLANSIVVAAITTVIAAALSSMAGYALARTRWPGRSFLAQSILVSYTVPKVLLVIPALVILADLQLTNRPLGLVLPYLAFSLPFGIWLMRGFFDGLPSELEESAFVDGASRLTTFVRVMLPLAMPGVATVAVFTFMLAWNDYFFALVLLNSQGSMTFPIGVIAGLTGPDVSVHETAALMAASVIACIPVVLVFAVAQKFFVQGLASGAVKG